MALEAAQTGEGPARGSSSAAVVPHRVRREPPPAPCREEAAPLRGGSHRSSGWPLRTRRRLFSCSMIIPRAWSGRVLTSGSRPCWTPWTRPEELSVRSLFLLLRYLLGLPLSSHVCVFTFLIPVFFLVRFLLLVAGKSPNFSASRRQRGIAFLRRPGYERTWPPSLLPPRSERPRHVRMWRRPMGCSRICR